MFTAQRIVVTLLQPQLKIRSAEDEVGVYASLPIDLTSALEIAIEEDFACLDRSDDDNSDEGNSVGDNTGTFANPMARTVCQQQL
jgi:hypothetical protein